MNEKKFEELRESVTEHYYAMQEHRDNIRNRISALHDELYQTQGMMKQASKDWQEVWEVAPEEMDEADLELMANRHQMCISEIFPEED